MSVSSSGQLYDAWNVKAFCSVLGAGFHAALKSFFQSWKWSQDFLLFALDKDM